MNVHQHATQIGLGLSEAQDSAGAATEAAAQAKAIQLVGAAREQRVDLAWYPVVDGVARTAVIVRRLTVAEMSAWTAAARAKAAENPDAPVRYPAIFFDDGTRVSEAVIDALDVEDWEKIEVAVSNFLPTRFRAAEPNSSSAQAAGGSTGPS